MRNEAFHLLFSDLSTQRQHFARELKGIVSNLGEKVETNGSFSAALHRGWMNLKAAITSGDDRAILAECERGEDAVVAEYCEALQKDDLPVEIRSVVQQQALGVKAAHDRVHDLRESVEH